MLSHRYLPALLLVLTGCANELYGPDQSELYVLQRIGTRPLPTYFSSPGDSWLIVADSLFVPALRLRTGDVIILSRVEVSQIAGQPPSASRGRYRAEASAASLVIDTCPIGALCVQYLVYAPFTLKIDGDSLREAVPTGQVREPRVYGLVRSSPRPR